MLNISQQTSCFKCYLVKCMYLLLLQFPEPNSQRLIRKWRSLNTKVHWVIFHTGLHWCQLHRREIFVNHRQKQLLMLLWKTCSLLTNTLGDALDMGEAKLAQSSMILGQVLVRVRAFYLGWQFLELKIPQWLYSLKKWWKLAWRSMVGERSSVIGPMCVQFLINLKYCFEILNFSS